MKYDGRIRLWLDELQRIPDYSYSTPTGMCEGKVWKSYSGYHWFIRCYLRRDEHTTYIRNYEVILLQGPRRGNEPLRVKISCGVKRG